MTTPEVAHLLSLAEESHQGARILLEKEIHRFSAAQSYYTLFYLAQALLISRGLKFSSHSAVIAAYGREFAKTQLLDPKYHRYLIDAQMVRETGHYGDEGEEITAEQAWQSFHWAEEFMQETRKFLGL